MLKKIKFFGCCLIVAIGCAACTGSDEEKKEGAVKQATDAVAQKAIDHMKTPIDQAKRAKELTESHNKAVEDATKQQ